MVARSPNVPTFLPLKVAPRASQLSSISQRLCFLREIGNAIEIVGIAQSVRNHDSAGAITEGSVELRRIGLIVGHGDVDEDGNAAILDDGIDGGGKSGSDGDDLIARDGWRDREAWVM